MDFDEVIDWRGSGATKWDAMGAHIDDSARDGIPMWVATMDFRAPDFLVERARAIVEQGEYGYFVGTERMFEAAAWWQETRHGWRPDPAHCFATHGLGNAIGLCLQALTEPGDGVIIFSPVYHEFSGKIRRNGRAVIESPLRLGPTGLFEMDLASLEERMTGTESLVMISAPHNPAGRIWTAEELRALAEFCARHDLILVSDEIHQDVTMPGHDHVPAGSAIGPHADRLVMLGAASKTFNIAGLRTGYVNIPDDHLRARFGRLHRALDIQPNRFGMELTCAAYSEAGAAWVDEMRAYVAGNAEVFAEGVNAIPGVSVMPMQGTFLAWVDFTGTGMSQEEIDRRVKEDARLLPTPGPSLGIGGALHHRFNIGTRRALVEEAVARLQRAFGDLQ